MAAASREAARKYKNTGFASIVLQLHNYGFRFVR